MVIDVSDIIKHYGTSKKILFNEELPQLNDSDIKFVEPVEFNGEITNNGRLLILSGNLKSKVKVNCDKCLKEFVHNLDIEINETFSNEEDEDVANLIINNSIFITQIVNDNLLLNMPMKFVCSDDCKGLCQICGKNNNLEDCSCNDEDIDPRLLKLKELLK